MKILHIENDPVFARQLSTGLTRHGAVFYEQITSQWFGEAIKRLSENEFDGVLLDWPLFNHPDFDIGRTFESLESHLPVLVLSRTDDETEAVRLILQGAQDWIVRSEVDERFIMGRLRLAIARCQFEQRGILVASQHKKRVLVTGGDEENEPIPRPPAYEPASSDAPCRVLLIDDDPIYHRKLSDSLEPLHFEVAQASRLGEAIGKLGEESYDAVIVDMTLPDGNGPYVVETIRAHTGESPMLVSYRDEPTQLVVDSIAQGAQDCLHKDTFDARFIARTIRLSAARQAHRLERSASPRDTAVVSTGTAIPCPPAERRRHSRYCLTKPALAIPILPDLSPDTALRAEGFTRDVSLEGIGFEVEGLERLPTKQLLLGIEGDDGVLYFATVEVRNIAVLPGRLRVGALFAKSEQNLLRRNNLIPSVEPKTNRLATQINPVILRKWVELGIFRPILVDRVFLCPKCKALPTFRNGCRACGSVRTACHQLVHHFACAFVGLVEDFEQGGELICPKCRARNLIVGADFEYLNGPFRCLDCDWSDTELEIVGQCLHCEFRFPVQQSLEEELIGYHVNRLDPVALIGAT